MKKYLNCIITTDEGFEISNPLKLSEAWLISRIAQENKSVTITLVEVTKERFKLMFD